MSTLIIDDEIAKELEQIAHQQNRSVDAVLRDLLASYATSPEPSNWPLQIARMAEADTDIEWNEDAIELSERSREILRDEFADYLLKRLHDDDHDSR